MSTTLERELKWWDLWVAWHASFDRGERSAPIDQQGEFRRLSDELHSFRVPPPDALLAIPHWELDRDRSFAVRTPKHRVGWNTSPRRRSRSTNARICGRWVRGGANVQRVGVSAPKCLMTCCRNAAETIDLADFRSNGARGRKSYDRDLGGRRRQCALCGRLCPVGCRNGPCHPWADLPASQTRETRRVDTA